MNLLRGDSARLDRCTEIVTDSSDSPVKRSKPFKYTYEKEIVLYAHYKQLDYFSTECSYSPEAFRGTARTLIKNLEAIRPSSIIDIIRSGESFVMKNKLKKELQRLQREMASVNNGSENAEPAKREVLETFERGVQREGRCERCGYLSSNKICKACVLLEGLNAGRAKVRIVQEDTVEAKDSAGDGAALLRKKLESISI